MTELRPTGVPPEAGADADRLRRLADAVNDVLFAYDGSESSSAALRAAVAVLPGARFVVLVVRGNPIQIGQAGAARIALPDAVVRKGLGELERETASRGAALADAGVAIVRDADAEPAVVAAGSPWRAILEESRRRASDLVACGSRGLGGFGRAVLGSTSSALVHNADRPVLALPDGKTPVEGPLLIAYDGSEPARAAIRAAAKLFPGREAIVAHARGTPRRGSRWPMARCLRHPTRRSATSLASSTSARG